MKNKNISLFTNIVTTRENQIVSFHTHSSEEKELTAALNESLYITDPFDFWDSKKNHFVLARRNGLKYILFFKDFEEDNVPLRFYIAAEGEEWFDLELRLKEMDKANHELDAIIESSYDGIYITDKYGNTLKTNSAIERITGLPKQYYIGKNISHLLKRGILQESVTHSVIEQKKTVSLVQKNYHQQETLMTGSPIFNEEGEVEKVVTNIRDLSELNQLNEELKKAHQLNKKYEEEINRLKSISPSNTEAVLKSGKIKEIFKMVERMSGFDTTILILGETGAGKDVLARHIYNTSLRSGKGQFIKVNCGAIPKDLMESELFGYDGGAFSGANRSGKAGLFELANKGILFLDEVGELPLPLQVKLLRAVQEKEIMRVGGTKAKKVDVRLIAATNRDLKEMVKRGEFREDLYYRLSVVPIVVPSLKERKDDILPLVFHFLKKYNQKYQVSKSFDKALHDYLYQYHWPGNVRELSNLIERLVITVPKNILTIEDLPEEYKTSLREESFHDSISLKDLVERTEKNALEKALKENKTTYEMAKKLKTSQATIVRKLQKYNLSYS